MVLDLTHRNPLTLLILYIFKYFLEQKFQVNYQTKFRYILAETSRTENNKIPGNRIKSSRELLI